METVFHHEKLPALALLGGMILTFLLIRVNTRLIRKGVSWWPGNIKPGGMHLHHIVFALPVMFVAAVLEFALQPPNPWSWILALFFGGAAGVVFDEYALILHLKDVYWEEEGRQSVVAVFLGVSFVGFMVVGLVPLDADPVSGEALSRWSILLTLVVNLAFVVAAFLKGRLWIGWIGIFVPFVSMIGALRLARPGSPWARWFYRRPWIAQRATKRAEKFDRRWGRLRTKAINLIAGAPTSDGQQSND